MMMSVMGKAMSAIVPMGAALVTEDVFDAFRGGKDKTLYYGHTFCGNPIGAALACLALTTHTQLLLPVVGFLFVLETVSVMLQVTRFRLSGKRFFRMAPIHHHFELGGWPETTVIIRFWIMAGLATALALGMFYADFISTGAIE